MKITSGMTRRRQRSVRVRWLVLALLASLLRLPGAAVAEEAGETPSAAIAAAAKAPTLSSEAAVLIDAKSGIRLFGLQADSRYYPASITKIVTAIIAIETTDPDDIVTVSKEARNEEGTRIYLGEGEQVSMGNLLYGLLMNSGNDAATAIAEYIDGSKEKFAERMNEFVRDKIGVTHSNFRNPSGLPDPDHYTTASDMAMIARYAMQNETFRKIVATKTMPWNGREWQSELVNHNKMLWTYEGATGVKNGYTEAAGNTLVVSATRGDMDLIGVVMKAPSSDAANDDMAKLLDYGFDEFRMKVLAPGGQTFAGEEDGDAVKWQTAEPLVAALPRETATPPAIEAESGQAYIETPLGRQSIGTLTEVSREPLHEVTAAGAEAAQPDAEETEAKAASRGGAPGVVVPMLILAALLAAWAGYRAKRRRERL